MFLWKFYNIFPIMKNLKNAFFKLIKLK